MTYPTSWTPSKEKTKIHYRNKEEQGGRPRGVRVVGKYDKLKKDRSRLEEGDSFTAYVRPWRLGEGGKEHSSTANSSYCARCTTRMRMTTLFKTVTK
jgi:hypothetical protein